MKKLILFSITFLATCSVWAQSPCDTLPVVNINTSNTAPCFGAEITLTADGGQSYLWNNGVTNGVAFTPSASDTFEVITTDTLGCKDTSTVFIEVLPLPDVVANSSSLNICLGDSVLLEATNANTYNWITPSIPNNTYFTPATSGINVFEVEGTGSNGCVNTSQVIVVVQDIPPIPTLNQDNIATCHNVAFDGNITGSAAEGRVIWFNDEGLTDIRGEQSQLPIQASTVGVTTYWASAFNKGCYSAGVPAEVEIYALPEVNAGEDVSVLPNERGSLSGSSNAQVTSTWTPSVNLESTNELDVEFTAIQSTVYTLEVVDGNNCKNTDQLIFDVDADLVISNVMTPNGDGDNDVWKIYPESTLRTCRVRLYDGFGRTMVYTDGYLNNWDGNYKGELVPDGDYYYYITCTGGFSKKGTLTILR